MKEKERESLLFIRKRELTVPYLYWCIVVAFIYIYIYMIFLISSQRLKTVGVDYFFIQYMRNI